MDKRLYKAYHWLQFWLCFPWTCPVQSICGNMCAFSSRLAQVKFSDILSWADWCLQWATDHTPTVYWCVRQAQKLVCLQGGCIVCVVIGVSWEAAPGWWKLERVLGRRERRMWAQAPKTIQPNPLLVMTGSLCAWRGGRLGEALCQQLWSLVLT